MEAAADSTADTVVAVALVAVVEATVAQWAAAWEAELSSTSPMFVTIPFCYDKLLTTVLQLPFQVGWQDLKDLFRQYGKLYHATDYSVHSLMLSQP